LSLDEIPQLINILQGEMSLIGPRPLLLSYYEWYNETELRRFNVRPGLTGLAQINGRDNLSWDERFSLDVKYADNLSFLIDVKIFFRSFLVVFSHKDEMMDDLRRERFDDYRKRILQQKNKKKSLPHLLNRSTKAYGLETLPEISYTRFINDDIVTNDCKLVRK